MLKLIKNAEVWSPEYLGQQDVLIADGRIAAINTDIDLNSQSVDVQVIDATGLWLMPGFVDPLAHFNGGGGEGGFHTRTPDMPITDAFSAGITTMVSGLGTDASTRSLMDMLAKARGLENEGLSTFCYTGSYEYPIKTISGSVRDDLILIDKFIGVGEVAIADKRGSQITPHELARLAADAKVGGLLSGKSGIVFLHVGDEPSMLSVAEHACADFDVTANQFYPTHINRHRQLMESAVRFARQGAVLDLTTSTTPELLAAGEIAAADALGELLELGVDENHISFSTDCNASLPDFDKAGKLRGLKVGRAQSLLESVQQALAKGIPTTKVLKAAGTNAADRLKLQRKGHIAVGADADILLMNQEDQSITYVIAKGEMVVELGKPLKFGEFQGS